MSGADPRDRELASVWREASCEDPPRRLDDAILARAREAVAARDAGPPSELWPLAHPRSWLMRWRVPLAVAATLVVSATLTLLVYDYGIEAPPPVVTDGPLPKGAPPARPATPGTTTDRAPAAPAPEATEPAKAAAGALPPPPAATREAPSATPPPPEAAPGRATMPEREGEAPGASREMPGARALGRAPAAAGDVAPRTAPAPSVTPAAPPAAARDAALPAQREQAAPDAAREQGAALATPEAYVERIRELRRAGRDAEARALLEELRRRFPAFALPEDLEAR
ncbi:MAG: hypothetical protein N2544_05885 [Burkholderiales bacterium]|nr:hypothetical protein [Burkholderiales bacterium]